MEQYWMKYCDVGDTGTAADSVTYTGDYEWYPPTPYYAYPTYTYHVESKTEKAYKILKVLVKEEVVSEPKSFKKFCDLIEQIAKVI